MKFIKLIKKTYNKEKRKIYMTNNPLNRQIKIEKNIDTSLMFQESLIVVR